MNKVRIMSRYDEAHMGYVWYLLVGDVCTQAFDSLWDAIVAGTELKESREDKLELLWDVAMELSRVRDGIAILYYKLLLDMFGEK